MGVKVALTDRQECLSYLLAADALEFGALSGQPGVGLGKGSAAAEIESEAGSAHRGDEPAIDAQMLGQLGAVEQGVFRTEPGGRRRGLTRRARGRGGS